MDHKLPFIFSGILATAVTLFSAGAALKNRVLSLVAALLIATGSPLALADKAAEIDRDVEAAMHKLYGDSPAAAELARIAKGVMIFPNVIKAGLLVGGQYGEGALLVGGRTVGYFNTVAASYGLQAGAQTFGYAMFFMTDSALDYARRSDGWELGAGPSVVVVDEGLARSLSTTSVREDVYVFIFGQKGLMAGVGVQGSKISRLMP